MNDALTVAIVALMGQAWLEGVCQVPAPHSWLMFGTVVMLAGILVWLRRAGRSRRVERAVPIDDNAESHDLIGRRDSVASPQQDGQTVPLDEVTVL